MKKILIILLSVSLFGCSIGRENHMKSDQLTTDVDGFVEPEPTEWVEFIKPVSEYMHYRTQSVLGKDINILWKRYPDLKMNIDQKHGINNEKYHVETLSENRTFIDANFNEEGYERIKVKSINETEAIVLVHGGIGYLTNEFDTPGGEILIKLFLTYNESQWDVVKTDEYLLHEYKEWLEKK